MKYGGIDLKAESTGKGQGIKMTREEIADELFSAGKEVKQCFLSEIAVGRNGRTWDFVYSQYMQLLNNLNILYNSLENGKEGFDRRIAGLLENREEKAFSGCFVSILDEMLINTIKHRQKYCLIRRNDRVPGIASHIIIRCSLRWMLFWQRRMSLWGGISAITVILPRRTRKSGIFFGTNWGIDC